MIQITKNPIILVDGSFYLYRAYHALPTLKNSVGETTGAIYGVLNMLKSLLIQYQSNYTAVVFDAKGKTFRDILFKHYKSHRPSMPEDLRSQITPLYNVIKAMGLPLLTVSGVEADDVIGTLALQAARDGRNVLISSGDKDMAQLVSQQITLINTTSHDILGPEEVQMKFGVPPALIIDYLALIGDNSDNIPGVPGVGKKTTQILLQKLGGLKALYQQLDSISSLRFRGAKTIAAKLEQYREVAFFSYQLATIKTDVPLDYSYDSLTVKKPKAEELMLLFKQYEFTHWINDLKMGTWPQRCTSTQNYSLSPFITSNLKVDGKALEAWSKNGYVTINTMETLETWIDTIRRAGIFAFNAEIDGLDTLTGNLIGLCFSVKPGEAAYLPVGHDYLNAPKQLNHTIVLAVLKPIFEDSSISKISQDIKFVYKILKRYNIGLNGILFDTMLESYVLDSVAGRHNDINNLAKRFLHYTTMSFEKISGKDRNQLTFNQIAMEKAAFYAAEKADVTLRLHQKLWPRIKQVRELKEIFENIEMPLIQILSRIEHTGVLINKLILAEHSMKLGKRLKELVEEAHQLTKKPFNLSSTKQLRAILYDQQKLPVLQKTPGGAPSTNEEALAKLALNYPYPLPRLILEYRALYKLKSTYTDRLPKMINRLSKRVHTSYHQTITTTGRLSSTNPNLQNIPVRNDEGRRIRQAFIAPPNTLIVTADYSQIELRVMAHLSHDSRLLNAFAVGQDIHCITAAEIFRIPLETVTKDQRHSAKVINFSLIYGMSAFGLARLLSVPRSEAQQYINLYFENYPGILEYMKKTRRQASSLGYVETLDGRRLYLPDIHSINSTRKKSAERAAINAPIQGTAADIIKRAMISINSWLQQETPPVRMIIQVHDELVFEVKRSVVESAVMRIKAMMENCFKLDVPLQVQIGIGENWDQAH